MFEKIIEFKGIKNINYIIIFLFQMCGVLYCKADILGKVFLLTFINHVLCILTAYLQSHRLCATVLFMTLKHPFICNHHIAN